MATYVYECPTGHHGATEITKPMNHAAYVETCAACGAVMRRVYTAVAVQNSTATVNSLVSWGADERPVKVLKRDFVRETRRERLEREVDR